MNLHQDGWSTLPVQERETEHYKSALMGIARYNIIFPQTTSSTFPRGVWAQTRASREDKKNGAKK